MSPLIPYFAAFKLSSCTAKLLRYKLVLLEKCRDPPFSSQLQQISSVAIATKTEEGRGYFAHAHENITKLIELTS